MGVKVSPVQYVLINLSEWWMNNEAEDRKQGSQSYYLCDPLGKCSSLLPDSYTMQQLWKKLETLEVILNCYSLP